MALPYSKRFIARQGLRGTVSASVPAGKVWVVKFASCFTGVGAGSGVHYRDATTGFTWWWVIEPGVVQVSDHLECSIVFPEGHRIEVDSSVDPVDVYVGGYELSA